MPWDKVRRPYTQFSLHPSPAQPHFLHRCSHSRVVPHTVTPRIAAHWRYNRVYACSLCRPIGHWRSQGGHAPPRLGSQENSWLLRCPMAGQKKSFFVKIERLSSFTWSVLKSSDISTRLRLTRLTFDNFCIAYLIEIRKFCSKNLVHKGVNFEAQNALKLTYEHL